MEFGNADLIPDAGRSGAWTLYVDGAPQSYVDMDDPTRIEFGYMRRLASVLDALAAPGSPLRVLHLGGGALTLPRYVAATRPRSLQRVVERDAALTALVRRVLPTPPGANLRVRVGDARQVVETAAPGRFDAVIGDVYRDARMPAPCGTAEFVAHVARVLRPGGCYAVNLTDGPPGGFARRQVATLRSAFTDVCLIADPSVLRARRFGNLVAVAVTDGGRLPVDALSAALARDRSPAWLLHEKDLDRFVAGARVVTDHTAVDSPAPPRSVFH